MSRGAKAVRALQQRLPRIVTRSLRRALQSLNMLAESAFMRVSYTVPRQVVLITTRHGSEENVWPMDWHGPLSIQPSLYGIAVNRGSYGAELIRKSGIFVVNFMPASCEK